MALTAGFVPVRLQTDLRHESMGMCVRASRNQRLRGAAHREPGWPVYLTDVKAYRTNLKLKRTIQVGKFGTPC